MDQSSEILGSWEANAQNWIRTIEQGEIESRLLATNDAIVHCILSRAAGKILDIGCGEGWLTRKLKAEGWEAHGVDGVRSLVTEAINRGGPGYFHATYEEISQGRHFLPSPFDAAVMNFALIDKENTEKLIHYIPHLLQPGDYLFIQTLHPFAAAADGEYVSGWRQGSWSGMKQNFVRPYSWYFRTLEDWLCLFREGGFSIEDIKEPVHPSTKKPLSVIFVLKAP